MREERREGDTKRVMDWRSEALAWKEGEGKDGRKGKRRRNEWRQREGKGRTKGKRPENENRGEFEKRVASLETYSDSGGGYPSLPSSSPPLSFLVDCVGIQGLREAEAGGERAGG